MPIDNVAVLFPLFFGFLVVLFGPIVWWRIFGKTGQHPALSLLMFVPFVNLMVLLLLAFGEWPIEKELKTLRQSQRG